MATVLFALTTAHAQSSEPFDPVSSTDELSNLREILANEQLGREQLSDLAARIELIATQAESCVASETVRLESLQAEFEILKNVTDFESSGQFSTYDEVRTRLNDSRIRLVGCNQLVTNAKSALQLTNDKRSEVSARYLGQRTDNAVTLIAGLPQRLAEWNSTLRASMQLELAPGLTRGALLALLITTGLLAGGAGLWVRRKFWTWFEKGNPAGAKHRLKYLIPKPPAEYAPLLLQGLALTGVLMLTVNNADLELPIVRVALGVFLYGVSCVIIEWATGPLSPSANVEGLVPNHVIPLRRRLRLVALVLVIAYIVAGRFWLAQRMTDVDDFMRLFLLLATGASMLFALFYLRKIPGLQGRFRIVRYAGVITIAVGLVGLALGYHNLAAFTINGVVQTAIALVILWIVLWLTLTGFEALSAADSPVAVQVGDTMGLSKDKPNSILGFMQLATDLILWLAFIVFIVGVWDSQGSTVDNLKELITDGAEIGNVNLNISNIIAGIIGFVSVVVVTGWIRRWVDRRWFRHLGMDRGARDALVTLLGYVGFVLALLLGLSLANISLSGLTFVASALAVGIGFGLQAITSNFVSGLILLLERPIKAGDFVSVGDTEGFIRQVRIRATEIETLDDQNVMVPNSELISGRVTNWVLRDARGRLRIQVGVAYGSDVELVRDLLVEIAANHPEVINDGTAPAPRALFMSFGDSSLDFELRVRIKRIERRYTVQSDINFSINAAFEKHGISIPFPQRDLHVISTPDKPAATEAAAKPDMDATQQLRRDLDQITRRKQHKVTLETTIENVWQAITDNDIAKRWLAPNVEINARIGGSYKLVLENDRVVQGRIDTFMPPRRLRVVLQPPEGDSPLASGPIMEEIVLSGDEKSVVLTVNVSGIPATEDWEHYYRSSEDRWTASLKELSDWLNKSSRPSS
ncbi:MAG: mechanosensitive ion channel domain-containing protein [Pseudomonadota bacterium]